MSQGKAFATSVIKLALLLTTIAAAASLPVGAAFAAHSIRAGIYEEFPVELRCLTTGNCIVYFDTVDRDLIVDKVSCTLKMKTTNNPRILRVVLGRATADKASFAESFFLPAPRAP